MTDRLRQALDQFDDFFQKGDTLTFEGELAAAARLVVEGERVWWCEEHKAEGYAPSTICWVFYFVHSQRTARCRMVERLLTRVPE